MAYSNLFSSDETHSLEYFGTDKKGSMNRIILRDWLMLRPELDPQCQDYKLRLYCVFNEAYLICYTILRHPDQMIEIAVLNKMIHYPSLVYPLSAVYLEKIKKKTDNQELAVIQIMNTITHDETYKQNYENLQAVLKKKSFTPLDISEFSRRILFFDVMKCVRWDQITGYEPTRIDEIIRLTAKDQKEIKLLDEAIYQQICSKYSENFGPLHIHHADSDFFLSKEQCQIAAQRFQDIIESDGSAISLLPELPTPSEEETQPSAEEDPTAAPTLNLSDFICDPWFDDFSTDPTKYSEQWRKKMVVDLLHSDEGQVIINAWWKDPKDINHLTADKAQKNKIMGALAGGLLYAGVLEGTKKEIAGRIIDYYKDEDRKQKIKIEIEQSSFADYMGSKADQSFWQWLKEYVEQGASEQHNPTESPSD